MDSHNVSIDFSLKTILWALLGIFSLWLILALKDVIFLVLLSFILAMAITPFVEFLKRKGVPRTLSVAGVIIAVIGLIYLVVSLIIPPLVNEVSNILDNRTDYVLKITSYFQYLSPILQERLTSFLDNFFASFNSISLGGVITGAKGFFNGVFGFILVIVLSFYILQNNKGVEGAVVAYVPKQHQKRTLSIYRKISGKMTAWLRGQVILGLIIFAVTLVGLSILKVDYALTLAVIAGLMEVLPIIGPLVAGGLAVLIALTQSPLLALIVMGFYLLVQQLENHILVPQVMKKSLGLNPIAVILAIIIGGKLLGFIGILISVPVTAAIGVLLEEFVKKQEEEAK